MGNKTQTTSHHRAHTAKQLVFATAALAAITGLGVAVALQHSQPVPSKSPNYTKPSTVSNQGDATKQPTPSTPVQQQSGTDLNGQTPTNVSNTDQSKWITSTSGAITVKNPIAMTKFKDGDTLFGSATVQQISYRLIDDTVGVISQGTANVVNGSFSVAVHFKSYGTSGRLDVFTTDPEGRELNEVQVKVLF